MEKKSYKNYFLGLISAEDAEIIEQQIISDQELEAELLEAENSLIEDYLDGNLTNEETQAFNANFLVTEERRERVEFVKMMTAYAKNPATVSAPVKENKPSFFEQLKSFLSPRKFAFGFGGIALILTIGFISYLGWKNYSNNSSNSEISILLNKTFKNDRPTEARITGFDYAPKSEGTRGNNDKNQDLNFVSAKSRATEAVLKNETAENLHQLGRVYLAEKNFDEAIKQFEKAIKLNPNLAKLHNDLGAALMEKAKQKEEGKLELFAKANEEIEKSIELDKNLTAAYFNRALVIESLNLRHQAKEAWENYLKLDSSSQWADEAREHLQKLETNKPISKTKEEILKDFFVAKEANDDEKVWQIVSSNRELIEGKLIPQQLAFLFVDSKVNKDEATANKALDALEFVGRIEEKKSGDLFWKDLGNYYRNLDTAKVTQIKLANEASTNAFEFMKKRDYINSLKSFEETTRLLLSVGNEKQAKLNAINIINCLSYVNLNPENSQKQKLEIIDDLLKFAQPRKYFLLQLYGFQILTSIQNENNQFSSAIKSGEKSYKFAERTNDSFYKQRILAMFATIHTRLGDKKKATDNIQKVFQIMNESDFILRQKWRNYYFAADLFFKFRDYGFAKLLVNEEVKLAEQIGQFSELSTSQTHAGIIYAKTKDLTKAREFLTAGLENAKKLPEGKAQKSLVAFSILKIAELEQEMGNYQESAHLFEESKSVYSTPYFELEIQKGRLKSFLGYGDNAALEKQIPLTIKIAEENRQKILEEEQSRGFVHNENDIFDTAIEWEFNQKNFEKSYNYLESASARSLLLSLEKSKTDKNNSNFNAPFQLTEIQHHLPEQTQLLQYAVLDKKVLIWLVTRDKFIVKEVLISSDSLQKKVEDFVGLILNQKIELTNEFNELSKEVFNLLIQPIYNDLDKEKQLCLIPNKMLFLMPFSALTNTENKFLLEEFEILYSPSANIFLHCTKNAQTKESQTLETFLGIGNPAFDKETYSELVDLNAAVEETQTIAQMYENSRVKLGKDATKEAFKEKLSEVEVLHFAGHYLVKPNLPEYSSLIFAKDENNPEQSILTNAELAQENLKMMKLVVLSACETGVETFLNGEGMIGLSRTFLALDTPLVVASYWKVDSNATADLMKEFHRNRRIERLTTTVALRNAQLEMLKDSKYRAPYYWSAFATFGGYSRF